MRLRRDDFTAKRPMSVRVLDSRCRVSTACERLLSAFILVSFVLRRARPLSIIL